ncbi:MAG: hypothetical protein PVJ49_18965, partial [Acidobacteriota bacterium]
MKRRYGWLAAIPAVLMFVSVAVAAPPGMQSSGSAPAAGALAPAVAAQEASSEKKPLTLADYPRWSRINSVELSADGAWMSYAYDPNEGDSTLYVRELDGDRVYEATNGSGPAFSDDSRWVAFITSPPESEGGRGGGGGRGGRGGRGGGGGGAGQSRTLELIELATGQEQEIANARAFEFADGSHWLAVHKNRADREAEHEGADLLLRNLDTGASLNLGNVSQYAFNEGASLLAYLVDAADMSGNGLYAIALADNRITPLDTSANRYAQLSWSDDGTAVAALRGDTEEGLEQRANTFVAFRDVAAGSSAQKIEYDPAGASDFPAGFVLSEHSGIDWSADGSRVFVGIKEQREEIEERDGPQPDVDVWHWKDERVQSVQMVRANADRNFTYESVLLLAPTRFVRLADDA